MTNDLTEVLTSWRGMLSSPVQDMNREINTQSTFRCVYGVSEGQAVFFIILPLRPRKPDLGGPVHIEVRLREDNQWTLLFRLVDKNLTDVFLNLVVQLAEQALQADDQPTMERAVYSVIEQWRRLLAKEPAGLTDEALRGLVGELWVLQHVVLPGFEDPVQGLHTWTGPDAEPQDFLKGNVWAREVKSAGPHAKEVTINGANQLDSSAVEQLTLDLVTVDQGAGGWNLREIAEAIERPLGIVASHAFRLKLSQRVPAYDRPDLEERRLAVRRHRAYRVDENFPHIEPSTVAPGITELTYAVRLTGLTPVVDRNIAEERQWIR